MVTLSQTTAPLLPPASAEPPAAPAGSTSRPKPPPIVHFVAGGLGAMCGGVVTAPFDLVKTRLQSSLFQTKLAQGKVVPRSGIRGLLWNFADVANILKDVYKFEGPTALFRGLGPTLVGAVPSRSINFFVYGNGKHLYAELFNHGQENAFIHLGAAASAGVVTSAATNPIWVVKTVMQLQAQQRSQAHSTPPPPPASATLSATSASAAAGASTSSAAKRPSLPTPPKSPAPLFSQSFRSASSPTPALATPLGKPTSYSTAMHIFKTQGVRGFYRGLSASLLGVSEGTIQWALYEQFKLLAQKGVAEGEEAGWRMSAAAGGAKLVATMITYPHEVVRTRLRQPSPANEPPKYHGLVQTFRLVLQEEGIRTFYNGMAPHLLRVVPNAITMFAVYEAVLRWSERRTKKQADALAAFRE